MLKIFSSVMLFLILVISGCATLNEAECVNSDWRLIGYEDGVQGFDGSRIGNHRKACAKHGITPDAEVYREGRSEGLVEFCQPLRAFQYGLKGKTYTGVCPPEYEREFRVAYREGHGIHVLTINISRNESKLRSNEKSITAVQKEAASFEKLLVSNTASSEERSDALSRIKALSKEQQALEDEIKMLIAETAVLYEHLYQLEAQTVYL